MFTKKIGLLLSLAALFITITSLKTAPKSYDIEEVYSSTPAKDVKVLTSKGEIADAELLLAPCKKYQTGKYTVTISRKASNLYQIDGKDIFIKTRYCNEYITREDVVMVIESNYGYTRGKLIFP
jgi:hypothetical protein